MHRNQVILSCLFFFHSVLLWISEGSNAARRVSDISSFRSVNTLAQTRVSTFTACDWNFNQPRRTVPEFWEVMLLNSIHFLCPMQSVGQWKVSCNRCNRISSDWRSLDLRPSTVLDSRRLGRIEAFRPIARASCFIFRCFSFPWPTQSMNWGSIQPHTHKQVVLELLFPKPKDRKPIPARLNWRQQFQDSGYSQF